MATMQQIQAGAAKYVDSEILPSFEGWQKILLGGGVGLILKGLPKTMQDLAAHPLVAALGVYNAENGTVDVDAAAEAFLPRMGAETVPITIPGGITLRMGRADFEKLIRYIKEA